MIEDKNSREWQIVKKWAKQRLIELRNDNENDHDFDETNRIRGGIREIRALLALEEPEEQKVEIADTSYID